MQKDLNVRIGQNPKPITLKILLTIVYTQTAISYKTTTVLNKLFSSFHQINKNKNPKINLNKVNLYLKKPRTKNKMYKQTEQLTTVINKNNETM